MIFRTPQTDAMHVAYDWARDEGLDINAFMGEKRTREFVRPRQECMEALDRETNLTFSDIGRIFGRDHTTVMHSVRRVHERRAAQ